jgi:hypothetical protein
MSWQGSKALASTTLVLVLANLVPIAGVVYWDWSVYTLLLLFWTENLILGIFAVARFWVLWRYRNDSQGVLGIPLFCLHFGGFMIAHLVLLNSFFAPEEGPIMPVEMLALPFMLLLVSHGISFFTHYIGKGEYRRARPGQLMAQPYLRVLAFHTVTVIGGFLVAWLGEPLVALLMLVVAKIVIDAIAHLREHGRKLAAKHLRENPDRHGSDIPEWKVKGGGALAEVDLSADDAPLPETDELLQSVASQFDELAVKHREFRTRALRDTAIVAGCGLILAIVLLMLTDFPLPWAFFTGVLLATVLALLRVHRLRDHWQEGFNKSLLPVICKRLGNLVQVSSGADEFLQPFEKFELISTSGAGHFFGPHFRGRYRSVDFEFGKLAMSRRSNNDSGGDEMDLDGLVLRFRLPFKVDAPVRVKGKSMLSGMRHMVQVDLADATFSDGFAAFAHQDHPDPERLALSVLDPSWRKALFGLNMAYGGGPGRHTAIQAMFLHDSLFLTLRRFVTRPTADGRTVNRQPGREFFDIPLGLFKKLDTDAGARKLIEDTCIGHRIIDRLPLTEPTTLSKP